MRVKENPDMYDSLLLNDKGQKEFQNFIGVFKLLIVAGIF